MPEETGELMELLVQMERKVPMVQQVHQGQEEQMEIKETKVKLGQKEIQANQGLQGLEQKETQVRMGYLELKEIRETKAPLALKVPTAVKVMLDKRERKETQDKKVNQAEEMGVDQGQWVLKVKRVK